MFLPKEGQPQEQEPVLMQDTQSYWGKFQLVTTLQVPRSAQHFNDNDFHFRGKVIALKVNYERSLYDRLWIIIGFPIILVVGIYELISVSWILTIIWTFVPTFFIAREFLNEAMYAEFDDEGNLMIKTLFEWYKVKIADIECIKESMVKYVLVLKNEKSHEQVIVHKNWPYTGDEELPFIKELKSRITDA